MFEIGDTLRLQDRAFSPTIRVVAPATGETEQTGNCGEEREEEEDLNRELASDRVMKTWRDIWSYRGEERRR